VGTMVTNKNLNLNNGLVAHYEFEGNANDSSGNGNHGTEHGLIYMQGNNNIFAQFSRDKESRLQLPFSFMPKTGSLFMDVNIDNGYAYNSNILQDNNSYALIFTTDIQGGDVTWPGSTWLYANNNGDIELRIAGEKYEAGWNAKYTLKATNTNFNFDEWHNIGISFGKNGKYIYLDGKVVASDLTQTTELSAGGTHSAPIDIPTIGESVSGFWNNNQFEGGFKGSVDNLYIYNRTLSESEIQELYN